MAYGTVKVDNVTFTYNAVDATTTFSGFYASTTNNLTLSGTASAATFTGTTANFTNVNAQNISVTTALSGLTVTGTTASFTSGVFTNISGTTATFTSGIIASGTAALPSLAILSDPNTGLFSPGADQLAISTNGTERLRLSSTGEFMFKGAGTTPGTDKAVSFNGSAPANSLVIDSSGRLGLGTSNPGVILDVIGGARISGVSGTGYSGLRLFGTGTGYNYLGIDNTGGTSLIGIENSTGGALATGTSAYATVLSSYSNTALQFATNNTLRATITSGGLVGLGVSDPGQALVIGGGTNGRARIKITSGASNYGKFEFSTDSSSTPPTSSFNEF